MKRVKKEKDRLCQRQLHFIYFVILEISIGIFLKSYGYLSSYSSTLSLVLFVIQYSMIRNFCNPFIGALGIQEPVIPGEPLFKG